MANNKKNRTELKSYFIKNSIPTESNFADLIDGMLNLQDDRIFKLPGDPLSIEASGDSAGLQKVINFYTKFEDPNAPKPAWSLQLNPQTDVNGSKTSNAGFCVVDGQSAVSRLFIDKKTGYLGLGTNSPGAKLDILADSVTIFQKWNEAIRLSNKEHSAITHPAGGLLFGLHGTGKFYFADTNKQKYLMVIDATNAGQVGIGTGDGALPIAKLDIAQAARTSTHPTAIKGLYITGDFGNDKDGIEFRHSNGSQGIGFGYNTIYATGSAANQDLQLKPLGTGTVRVLGNLNVTGRIAGNLENLVSADNRWKVVMQTDRNLCVYSVNGGNAAWCSGSNLSDLNLKKNLGPIPDALKNILTLRGFSFNWKDESLGSNREIGVIAQDVEQVFPGLVSTITDRKFVQYNGLIAVLIEAMREQQTQIDALTIAVNH